MLTIERPQKNAAERDANLTVEYAKTWLLLERAHRALLESVKDELDRSGHNDLTAVQALMIFNVEEEAQLSDIRSRGQLSGANASYNLKKLVEGGYVVQERCKHDRRAVRVKLTEAGEDVRDAISGLIARHADILTPTGGVGSEELSSMNKALNRLARFWSDQVRFRM